MNFKDAIVSHTKWKKTLSDYINNPDGSLNPDIICKDNNCALGLWIYGEAIEQCQGDKKYDSLKSYHTQMHIDAADVVKKIHHTKNCSENELLGDESDFYKSSKNVIALLEYFQANYAVEEIDDHLKNLNPETSKKLIKQLLDNAGDGFISFPKDGKINYEFSKTAEDILLYPPGGKQFSKIFGEEKSNDITEVLELIFAGTMDFHSLVELLPKVHFLNLRYVEFTYRPIYDETKQISEILVIMKDVTRIRNAEKKAEIESQKNLAIVKILSNLNDFQSVLEEVETLKGYQESLPDALRSMHTLKGGFGLFAIAHLMEKCHTLETLLKEDPSPQNLKNAIAEIEKEVTHFLTENESLLKIGSKKEKTVQIPISKMNHLLNKILSQKISEEVKNDVLQLVSIPTFTFMKYLEGVAEQTSEKLSKQVQIVWGDDVEILPLGKDALFLSLVHVVKNGIDHGIEDFETRMERDKPEVGTIQIESRFEDGFVKIKFTDDGGGVNVGKLRSKLQEKFPDQKFTDEEVVDFIFKPGVSAKEEVTEHSGRGVGLDAVRTEAKKLGGDARVLQTGPQGTVIEVTFRANSI